METEARRVLCTATKPAARKMKETSSSYCSAAAQGRRKNQLHVISGGNGCRIHARQHQQAATCSTVVSTYLITVCGAFRAAR
jgi:hypothetical protein